MPTDGPPTGPAALAGWADKAQTFVRARWQTVAVIIAVLVVVLVATHKSPAVAPGTSIPTTPAPSGSPAPPTTIAPTIPSVTTMTSALATLSSGSATQATALLASSGSAGALARGVAFYYGLAHTGLLVSTSTAAAGSPVVSTLTVTDHATGTVVYTGSASWVWAGGQWKLVGWPAMSPSA